MKKNLTILFLLFMLLLTSCGKPEAPAATPAPAPEAPPAPPPKTASLLVAGDNLIHSTVYRTALQYGNGERYNFVPMYKYVREYIENADIAYINQETPLGGVELELSNYPMFNSPREVADALVEVGFDVVSHANNHILDRGERGIQNTIDTWRAHPGITLIGVYENQEDRDAIRVTETNGIKFAWLAYTYSTNGISLPQGSPYIVPDLDAEVMADEIWRAKRMSDFVIVIIHWGNENSFTPSAQQREYAQLVSDAGADVILGSHPHVIQPIEYVGDTLVIYSLGNLFRRRMKP